MSTVMWTVLGLVVLVGAAGSAWAIKSSRGRGQSAGAEADENGQDPRKAPSIRKFEVAGGLLVEVLKEGSGNGAERGDFARVHYTGWLTDGKKFDSSRDRGTPFEFKLGQGKVIAGWEQGVKGMKTGEHRRLTVPANMGYGSRGNARIPGNSVLIFEVELIGTR